jgi:hypothetical protein
VSVVISASTEYWREVAIPVPDCWNMFQHCLGDGGVGQLEHARSPTEDVEVCHAHGKKLAPMCPIQRIIRVRTRMGNEDNVMVRVIVKVRRRVLVDSD